MTRCAGCGVLCEAFPISDLSTLQLYLTKGCTIIVGDLYMINLPSAITKTLLSTNLKNIQYIRGTYHLKDSPWLGSLLHFKGLLGLYGAYYSNNPNLVDTRMPALKQMTNNVTVVNCDRLCPARYTRVGAGPSDGYCPNLQLQFFFQVNGDFSVQQLPLLETIVSLAMQNVSLHQVSPIPIGCITISCCLTNELCCSGVVK